MAPNKDQIFTHNMYAISPWVSHNIFFWTVNFQDGHQIKNKKVPYSWL